MAVRPGAKNANVTFIAMSECVNDGARWFLENGLLLNPAKTEAVLFGTDIQREKVSTASGIDVAGTVVPFCDSVKLLGFGKIFQSQLAFSVELIAIISINQNCDHFQTCFKDGIFCHSVR